MQKFLGSVNSMIKQAFFHWHAKIVSLLSLSAKACVNCIIFILFASALNNGLSLNMHTVFPEAVDDQVNAAAVAISEMKYGNLGYLGVSNIREQIRQSGLTKIPKHIENNGLRFPDNLRNPIVIEKALNAGYKADKLSLNDLSLNDRSLFSMVYADLGMVDYYKYSFTSLGLKASSPFIFFFILLALQILLLLSCFRETFVKLLVVIYLISLNSFVNTDLASNIELATLYNPRVVPILSVLPLIHVILFLSKSNRFKNHIYPLTVAQLLICGLILSMRSSTVWWILFLFFILAIVPLLKMLDNYWHDRPLMCDFRSLKTFFVRISLIALVVGGYNLSIKIKTHSSYGTEHFLPNHLRYHSMYLGLAFSNKEFLALHDSQYTDWGGNPTRGDAMGYNRSWKYLVNVKGLEKSDFISPLSGTFKMRLHDETIKSIFLSEVANNPTRFVKATLTKFNRLTELAMPFIEKIKAQIIVISIMISLLWFYAFEKRRIPYHPLSIIAIAITPLFSAIPYIVAYPNAIADFLTLIAISFCATIGLAIAALLATFNFCFRIVFKSITKRKKIQEA